MARLDGTRRRFPKGHGTEDGCGGDSVNIENHHNKILFTIYISINPSVGPGRLLLECSSRAAFVSRIFNGNGYNFRAFPQGYTSHFASVSDVSPDDINYSLMQIAQSRIESRSRQARTNRMGKIGCFQREAPVNMHSLPGPCDKVQHALSRKFPPCAKGQTLPAIP